MVWQASPAHENQRGGLYLDRTGLTDGTYIPAGTPVFFDDQTRKATVVVTAKLQANAASNAVNYRVEKGSILKVGDVVGARTGGAGYAITAIDTTATDYDQITLGTTLGVSLTAGEALFKSSAAAGATTAAIQVNALTYGITLVEENATLAVVLRGTLYARRAPAVPASVKALLPNIIWSESF